MQGKTPKTCKEKLKWEARRKRNMAVGVHPTGDPAAAKKLQTVT